MNRIFWIVLIVLFLPLRAAADTSQAEEFGLSAAKSWLALVDAGAYGESWDMSAQLFRGAITRQQWEQAVAGVRVPLGAVVERAVKSKTISPIRISGSGIFTLNNWQFLQLPYTPIRNILCS